MLIFDGGCERFCCVERVECHWVTFCFHIFQNATSPVVNSLNVSSFPWSLQCPACWHGRCYWLSHRSNHRNLQRIGCDSWRQWAVDWRRTTTLFEFSVPVAWRQRIFSSRCCSAVNPCKGLPVSIETSFHLGAFLVWSSGYVPFEWYNIIHEVITASFSQRNVFKEFRHTIVFTMTEQTKPFVSCTFGMSWSLWRNSKLKMRKYTASFCPDTGRICVVYLQCHIVSLTSRFGLYCPNCEAQARRVSLVISTVKSLNLAVVVCYSCSEDVSRPKKRVWDLRFRVTVPNTHWRYKEGKQKHLDLSHIRLLRRLTIQWKRLLEQRQWQGFVLWCFEQNSELSVMRFLFSNEGHSMNTTPARFRSLSQWWLDN